MNKETDTKFIDEWNQPNKTQKKYFISWLDSYNTWNHADNANWYENDIDKETGCLSKSGLKNIKESFAVSEVENYDQDGWVDCCHLVIVYAKNRTELNKEVERVFEENGRNVDVFSVTNENKSINLTEEDF